MSPVEDFLLKQKQLIEDEVIYIKITPTLVIVYYKHYKEDSIFAAIRKNNEINVMRNDRNILMFEKNQLKESIELLDDMLNTFAVYIAINYDGKRTLEEVENISIKNVLKDGFNGLFNTDKDDLDTALIRYRIKKSE